MIDTGENSPIVMKYHHSLPARVPQPVIHLDYFQNHTHIDYAFGVFRLATITMSDAEDV